MMIRIVDGETFVKLSISQDQLPQIGHHVHFVSGVKVVKKKIVEIVHSYYSNNGQLCSIDLVVAE